VILTLLTICRTLILLLLLPAMAFSQEEKRHYRCWSWCRIWLPAKNWWPIWIYGDHTTRFNLQKRHSVPECQTILCQYL